MAARSGSKPLVRMRSSVDTVGEVAVLLWVVAAGVVIVVGALMLVGLGVRALCDAVGMPSPSVHDDPARVELGGLALLVLYGCAGGAVLAGCYLVGRRVLSDAARAHLGRAIGALVLLGLAVACLIAGIQAHDIATGVFGVGFGYAGMRVALGLPLDDEHDTNDEESVV